MKSAEVQHIFESLKEQPTDDVISTRRFISSFVSSIRSSPIADNQEIDQIVSTFDPSSSGFIDLISFRHGIEQWFQNAEDDIGQHQSKMQPLMSSKNTACIESPVEGVAAEANPGLQHPKNISSADNRSLLSPPPPPLPQSLLSFDVESYTPPLAAEAPESLPESKSQKYSDDLTLLDCSLSAPSWTDSESNMSLVENNKANSQMEEHFEFTPSPEHALKKHDDDADEDFSYANGDNSYSSLKSATFSSQRNTWMRSSVRKNGGSLKRNSSIGPYASSPSYRNSPTNDATSPSRRSSLSYESDEMNADANLEEDVQNLNDQIKKLQEQIEVLSEAQMKNEVKYSSMKRENVNLGDKISFLEEHIRDIELQTEERKAEDERRFKDSMARLEREKSQELEKYVGQILVLQKELFEAKEEVKRHQQTIDALQSNKLDLESIIQDKESEIESLNEEIAKLKDVIRKQSEESHANSTLVEALNHELATLKQSSDLTKLEHHRMVHESEVNNINVELEKQVRSLKEENHSLKESNEELTAQLLNNHLIEGKSLLKEGEAISSLANEISDLNIEQLKTTLKEQQDVNAKLRAYIDGILLNIVENYPQLLEVKSN